MMKKDYQLFPVNVMEINYVMEVQGVLKDVPII